MDFNNPEDVKPLLAEEMRNEIAELQSTLRVLTDDLEEERALTRRLMIVLQAKMESYKRIKEQAIKDAEKRGALKEREEIAQMFPTSPVADCIRAREHMDPELFGPAQKTWVPKGE